MLSDPPLVSFVQGDYNELDSKFFATEEARQLISKLVNKYVPSTSTNELIINENYNYAVDELFHEAINSSIAQFIQFRVVGKDTSRGELSYDGKTLWVDFFAPFQNESASAQSYVHIIIEELYHLRQFLRGQVWFEKPVNDWFPVVDIFDEIEAKIFSAKAFTKIVDYTQITTKDGKTIQAPTLYRWYQSTAEYQGADREQIRKYLKEGSVTVRTICYQENPSTGKWEEIIADVPFTDKVHYASTPDSKPANPFNNYLRNDKIFAFPPRFIQKRWESVK